MSAARTVTAACTHDCPDACALLVTVENGRATAIAPNAAHPITGHHLCVKVDRYLERAINSSCGALPVLARAEPEPEIELAPADAQRRGIGDGAAVRVRNERGAVVARARVTDRVLEGTVAVPFGHWMRDGTSANALTSDRFGDLHGPTFCDALVEVAPAFHAGTAAGS